MKITGSGPAISSARVGATRSTATRARTSATDSTNGLRDPAIAGIPPAELTPRVREAFERLMDEVDMLRRALDTARTKIDELEKIAETDELTGVANRRGLVRELARAASYVERHHVPAALLFLDVDNLKTINDQHGHNVGDTALIHVAETLKTQVRMTDSVGRLGGDEFGVVLMHANHDQARAKGEQLAKAITARPAKHGSTMIPVSAAVGVCMLAAGEPPQDALARADAAMYARKRAGRSMQR